MINSDGYLSFFFFFFSSRRRHTRFKCDWSSDVCSSDLVTINWSLVDGHDLKCMRMIIGLARPTYVGTESNLCVGASGHHPKRISPRAPRPVKSVGKERPDAGTPFVPLLPWGHVQSRVLSQERG